MTRPAFEELFKKVEPFMPVRSERMASQSVIWRRNCVAHYAGLLVVLTMTYFGGWGVTQFFAENGVQWPTMEAIDLAFQIGLRVNDSTALRSLSEELSV